MFGCIWRYEPENEPMIEVTPRKKVFKYEQSLGSLGNPKKTDISQTSEGQHWLKVARSWGFPC